MKNTALYNTMKKAGLGYRACATAINKKMGTQIYFSDVYNFINRRSKQLGRDRKKTIKAFFILKGWIAAPKKRKAPVCRFCGKKNPVHKIKRSVQPRYNKRSTK